MLFDGYLICTDCDGTLTDTEGRLSKENAHAIRYFQKQGGRFTLATGRFANHLENFADQMEINAPMISLNGTLLYDTKRQTVLKEWKMAKRVCIPIVEYVVAHWPNVRELWMNCGLEDGIPFFPGQMDWHSFAEKLPEQWYKLVMIQEADVTMALQADLRARFGKEFHFDSSWPNGLEMQSCLSGKGVAVQWLKDYYQGAVHTTVCIGDAENDLNMLSCADISYAVANATKSAKRVADRLTVGNNEDALAHVIAELEAEIREKGK
ncbi:MAG: HAD-IIB family hydrolase [Lachnospiraceae bacterium]|nr:HAD-IIB family hydrolase [Lachnospiraceae bacterium]